MQNITYIYSFIECVQHNGQHIFFQREDENKRKAISERKLEKDCYGLAFSQHPHTAQQQQHQQQHRKQGGVRVLLIEAEKGQSFSVFTSDCQYCSCDLYPSGDCLVCCLRQFTQTPTYST